MTNHLTIEANRQQLQKQLDGKKAQEERNAKGQFSTPFGLAKDILKCASKLLSKRSKIRFLDPAFGTGSFFSALIDTFPANCISVATGYEIDSHYGQPSKYLWQNTILDLRLEDFTKVDCPKNDSDKYDLIICNPPYVRHHHIINDDKMRLQRLAFNSSGISFSGLAGLYCYFLTISHCWLKKNGIAGWLIPSEFMDVNYGRAIKEYLLNNVTLLQIHRFDPNDVQFDDAIVSSAIVWFSNMNAPRNHKVRFTFGGTVDTPHFEKHITLSVLSKEPKWTRFPQADERKETKHPKLNDYFSVKRGIATGDNNFFILTVDKIKEKHLPLSQFKPILPSPRYLEETEIQSDNDGNPIVMKQLFVLDCKLPFDEVKKQYPELWEYLKEGIRMGVPERYLCKHRKLWYSQESRPSSLFYCTYIGRSDKDGKKPFRFILNRSRAIVANAYLILYPRPNIQKIISSSPELAKSVVAALNDITAQAMLDEGRVYGGGLYKLEPKELSKVNATSLVKVLGNVEERKGPTQLNLFNDTQLGVRARYVC